MRRSALVLLVTALVVAASGCSKSVTRGATTTTIGRSLPFEGSPPKNTVAKAAGLVFPASTGGYESVRVDPSELDLTFTIAPDDVDGFVTDSGLGTLADGRIIQHSSPVFPQNPTGTVRSSTSQHGELTRIVEVVDQPGQPTVVRLVITTP